MILVVSDLPKAVRLADFRSESFEDELLVYNIATRQILTLNPVSATIWGIIVDSDSANTQISDIAIAERLAFLFDSDDDVGMVVAEVRAFIETLFSAKFFIDK